MRERGREKRERHDSLGLPSQEDYGQCENMGGISSGMALWRNFLDFLDGLILAI